MKPETRTQQSEGIDQDRVVPAQDSPRRYGNAQRQEELRAGLVEDLKATPNPDLDAVLEIARPARAPRLKTGRARHADAALSSGRAVLYIRVSTAGQARRGGAAEGYSIPAQRDEGYRKAEALGALVVDEYIDAGETARFTDRPGLQRMLARIADKGDVEFVIVHKLNR